MFDVATTLTNRAMDYYEQGKYNEAELLFQQALAIREGVLGPDHPDVAPSLINLAWNYYNQGRYAEGEPLFQRLLAIREKALGPDHPDVAITLYNLAAGYYKQGRYTEAEPLYQRALAIQEKALGPDHPNVARILNDLASLHAMQGRSPDNSDAQRASRPFVEDHAPVDLADAQQWRDWANQEFAGELLGRIQAASDAAVAALARQPGRPAH